MARRDDTAGASGPDERIPFPTRAPRAPAERGLRASGLSVQTWYKGRFTLALDNVSLRAEPGEVTTVTGGSLAVRSLLLRVLAGTRPYDAGSVVIDGVRMSGPTERVSTRSVTGVARFVNLRADVRDLYPPPRPMVVFVEEPFAHIEPGDAPAIAAAIAELAAAGHTVVVTDEYGTEIPHADQVILSMDRRPSSRGNPGGSTRSSSGRSSRGLPSTSSRSSLRRMSGGSSRRSSGGSSGSRRRSR